MGLEIPGVIPVKRMITPHGVVLVPAKEGAMDESLEEGLYSVTVRYRDPETNNEDFSTDTNLSWPVATALLQRKFEQSNGWVYTGTIERQEERL